MLKKMISAAVLICLLHSAQAQTTYTSTTDADKTVVLNGIVTKKDIIENPSFSWYALNQKGYTASPSVVSAMTAAKDKFQFLIFGGTWCSDTQNILPKFFSLQEMSGVQDKDISFFAVDHNKTTIGNMANIFKIVNVPTIIVLKDGKEVGRVVEYGKTGKWDQELADLLK